MKIGLLCVTVLFAFSLFGDNLLRNGNFTDAPEFNGFRAIFTKEEGLKKINSRGQSHKQTRFAGWWLSAKDASKCVTGNVPDEFGGQLFQLTGPAVLESTPVDVADGTKALTLSFDLKNRDAEGFIRFDVLTPWKDQGLCGRVERREEPLKPFDGRMSITIKIPVQKEPKRLLTAVSLHLKNGTAEIGRVQIEPGEKARPFERSPLEWLDVTLDDTPVEKLPRYSADSKRDPAVLPMAGNRTLTVRNRSGKKLYGTLNLYLDSWRTPGKTLLGSFALSQGGRDGWADGGTHTLTLQPGKLNPDAYVILAELVDESGKNSNVPRDIFRIEHTATGITGFHQLVGRNGLRFCVFPGVEPKNLFGVGNGMIVPYTWWTGFDHRNFAEARDYGVISFFGERDTMYQAALAGAFQFSSDWIDGRSDKEELNNPVGKNLLDITHPEARKELAARAERRGKIMAEEPGFCGVKLRNESPYLNGGATCPTESADRSFREWLKERYGSLKTVNSNWNTAYVSWDEIDQIVSVKMKNEAVAFAEKNKKEGAAAYNWYANIGQLSWDTVRMMQTPENRGRAMDWLRWRTWLSLKVYREYIETAKKFDRKSVYGTNFCWPNFWPQICMPFYRFSDAPMLDMQYAAPHRKDLGNSDEMIDMIEMAESVANGKPIWGLEVYLQPDFPAEFPALQNWGLLAHGMTHNMVFGWTPFSDHGAKAYESGPKSWLNPKAPPMWMIYDTDGTKLPTWYSNRRSTGEIAAFHKKYNGLSLKRIGTRVAWYIPTDTAEYILQSTCNRPYITRVHNARVAAAAALRFSGVTMNYFDDDALLAKNALSGYDFVLMPPSPVMSRQCLEVLASFVRNGGSLVMFGPSGMFDPWLRSYKNFGGSAWSELAWNVPAKWNSPGEFMKDFTLNEIGQATGFRNYVPGPGMETVLKKDGKSRLLFFRTFGKGKLYAVAETPLRYAQRTPFMHNRLRDLIQSVIEKTGLPRTALWSDTPALDENTPVPRQLGTGVPLVEVVVREKPSAGELFVFVLNQGGEGRGTVRVWTGRKNQSVRIEDVLTGKASVETGVFSKDGVLELPLGIKPWEYRVFRLSFGKRN